jgi:branched-subunit amino acid permease
MKLVVKVRQRIKALTTAGKTMDEAVATAPTKNFDAKYGSGYVTPDVFTKLVFSSLTRNSASR